MINPFSILLLIIIVGRIIYQLKQPFKIVAGYFRVWQSTREWQSFKKAGSP